MTQVGAETVKPCLSENLCEVTDEEVFGHFAAGAPGAGAAADASRLFRAERRADTQGRYQGGQGPDDRPLRGRVHPEAAPGADPELSLIHISEPTRLLSISYAV